MDDMRSEIRAAFEKEQAAHPPGGGLRTNLVSAAATQARPKPNLQWIAVAVAAVLGLLIVAGLMSTRLGPRANVPGNPKASSVRLSSPTPEVDYGPPPAGVPLVYVQDPSNSSWLIGFDWTGKPRGTVKLSQPLDPLRRLRQSPDGSAFGYVGGKGGYAQFLDRLGQPITGGSSLSYQDLMWADDGRHLCTLDYGGRQWNLGLRLPGAAAPSTSVVAIDPRIVQSGIIAISFAACSARNDRAILAYSYMGRPTEFWVVRISDGKIVTHRTYPADQLVNVTASLDGALVAENSGESTGQFAPAAPTTVIRRLSDRAILTKLAPSNGVVGFNSDDSLALVTTTPWASGIATHLALIDVQTGNVLWRFDGTEEFTGFLAEPNGRDFALMMQAPDDSRLHPSVDVVIVHSDGTSTPIPGRFVLT